MTKDMPTSLLPTELQYQVMDYAYGNPKELMHRVLHQIRYKRLMGEFWSYQGCFENDDDWPFEMNVLPHDVVSWSRDSYEETLYQAPRFIDETGQTVGSSLRYVHADRRWYASEKVSSKHLSKS